MFYQKNFILKVFLVPICFVIIEHILHFWGNEKNAQKNVIRNTDNVISFVTSCPSKLRQNLWFRYSFILWASFLYLDGKWPENKFGRQVKYLVLLTSIRQKFYGGYWKLSRCTECNNLNLKQPRCKSGDTEN